MDLNPATTNADVKGVFHCAENRDWNRDWNWRGTNTAISV